MRKNGIEFKLHLFDLLWICCGSTHIHNIMTCLDVVNSLYTLRQIHTKVKLSICCGLFVALQQIAGELVDHVTVMYVIAQSSQARNNYITDLDVGLR